MHKVKVLVALTGNALAVPGHQLWFPDHQLDHGQDSGDRHH